MCRGRRGRELAGRSEFAVQGLGHADEEGANVLAQAVRRDKLLQERQELTERETIDEGGVGSAQDLLLDGLLRGLVGGDRRSRSGSLDPVLSEAGRRRRRQRAALLPASDEGQMLWEGSPSESIQPRARNGRMPHRRDRQRRVFGASSRMRCVLL